ncbi:MAG: hypothetical protein AAFV53_00300 [Myxococcota bacterium]
MSALPRISPSEPLEPLPSADTIQEWLSSLRDALLSTERALPAPPPCFQGHPPDVLAEVSAWVGLLEGCHPGLRRDDGDDDSYLRFSAVWDDLEIRLYCDDTHGLTAEVSAYQVRLVRTVGDVQWG